MILTGPKIWQARNDGDLVIEPFDQADLNPNSYNFHLGDRLLELTRWEGDRADAHATSVCPAASNGGFLLNPGRLYLATTHEVIGSRRYVITLLGRSSIGRLGLFLNVTADLGHAGSVSQWTLELKVVQPLKIFPRMPIGQVAFWNQTGPPSPYEGRYHQDLGPVPSRDPRLSGTSIKNPGGSS